MNDDLQIRLKKIEDNINVCMCTNLALMGAFASLPEAATMDGNKARKVLRGLVTEQASLAALQQKAQEILENLVANANEAGRH